MPVNLNAFYDTEFDQHEAALDATRKELAEPFARLVGVCTASIRSGNKLVLFGNGGSAADCQHLAMELAVRYITDRPPHRRHRADHGHINADRHRQRLVLR